MCHARTSDVVGWRCQGQINGPQNYSSQLMSGSTQVPACGNLLTGRLDGPSRRRLWTLSAIRRRSRAPDDGNRKHFPASLRRRTIHPGGPLTQSSSKQPDLLVGVHSNTATALSSNFTVRRPGDTIFSSINPRRVVRGEWHWPAEGDDRRRRQDTGRWQPLWVYSLTEGTNRVTCEVDIVLPASLAFAQRRHKTAKCHQRRYYLQAYQLGTKKIAA